MYVPQEGLFDGLPVVGVKNWSDVTPAFLEATWHQMQQRSYSWEKIYAPYWLDKLLHPPGIDLVPTVARNFIPVPDYQRINLVSLDRFTTLNKDRTQLQVVAKDASDPRNSRKPLCRNASHFFDPALMAECWPKFMPHIATDGWDYTRPATQADKDALVVSPKHEGTSAAGKHDSTHGGKHDGKHDGNIPAKSIPAKSKLWEGATLQLKRVFG